MAFQGQPLGDVLKGGAPAVKGIAQDRRAERRELRANLMGFPSHQLNPVQKSILYFFMR